MFTEDITKTMAWFIESIPLSTPKHGEFFSVQLEYYPLEFPSFFSGLDCVRHRIGR